MSSEKFPSCQSSTRSVDSIPGIGRLYARDLGVPSCGSNSPLPFPSPVHQICGKSIHFSSRTRFQGSWRVLPPSQPFSAVHSHTYPPTHPPHLIPSLPRPGYDAMPFVFGNAGAWVHRLGLRNTTSRTQPASRSSGVRLVRSSPGRAAAAQETS